MRVVFLDRDGVINQDRDDYVKNVRELVVFPGVPTSIKQLNDAEWEVIVVSNQQGIAKGIITEEDLQEMQAEITRQVESAGGRITAFYYCKHLAAECCSCRKPEPGLLLKAAQDYGVDLNQSFMVGDSERDIIAGKSAGCRTVLVLSGKIGHEDAQNLSSTPDHVADNLPDAVLHIASL